MRLKNKKGSVLITLIIAMVIMAFLGLGIYALFTSSSFSELLSNRNDNAYQLAKAGIRYAVQYNAENGVAALGDFLLPDNSKKFNLVQNGTLVTSTGIVNEGTFLEARRVLQYTISPGILPPYIPDLPQKNKTIGTPGSIANDGTTIILGGDAAPGVSQSYGAIWYNGNNVVNNCSVGACRFNLGLRAYFEFQFPNDTNSGDGFTFAVMSALTNTNDRVGGFSKNEYPNPSPNTNTYWRSDKIYMSVAGGELMGYAGPGNTYKSDGTDGQGLRPPKMAVEFDTYYNEGYTPIYLAGTRNDPNLGTYGDHVALMFWGDSTLTGNTPALTYSGGGTRTLPLSSFDDNVHGAGQTGRVNGLGAVGYDMEDGVLRGCRIEITRPTSAVISGTYAGMYQYLINLWIEQTGALAALTKSRLQDVLVPYADTLTKISQYAYFTQAEHDNFANIYWGFTQGTGDKVQQVSITNSVVFFPNTATSCSYSISPTGPVNYSSAGGLGSVAITTTSDCYWAVQSLATSWLNITSSPLYDKGSGTISYTVTANSGPFRTGHINIAGNNFIVTQDSGCTYSITPTTPNPASFTMSGGNGTFSVATVSGCPWSATTASTWIHTTSTGIGNGSGIYTVDANTGMLRTGTIVVGGQSFTVTQAAGPPICTLTAGTNIVPYNGTNLLTWSVSNGPATTATWTASPGGTCGSPNPAGGSCTTAAQTTAGARTYNLTVTNASGSSTCSTTFYVGCVNYRVYNNTGGTRDFRVTGSGCLRIGNGNEITTTTYRMDPSETVTRYNTNNTTCGTALGSINYTAAMNADISYNGGDADCQVYYGNGAVNDTVVDR
jgi:hypothetical protein